MRVISRRALQDFWKAHPDAEWRLKAWCDEVTRATWENSAQLKEKYGSASIVGKHRVVFNICGNKYRLVVEVNYIQQYVFIKFIGTHGEYDLIDVESVECDRESLKPRKNTQKR